MRQPRALKNFVESPASIRNTIRVLVGATVLTTVGGGILMWIVDGEDFTGIGDAMWWALQTVTTVGYGDVTPKSTVGRYLGAAFLVYSVAFLSILTAAVTATFIEHARRQRRRTDPVEEELLARLGDIAERLDRLEQLQLDREPDRPDR